MSNIAASATSESAGVWIDHRKALIVGLALEAWVTTAVLSNAEQHPERTGDSPMKGDYEALQVPADDRRQRAFTGELNLYYDAVIAELRGYGKWLVFGPGEAKIELHARLVKLNLGERVAAVQTESRLTDRQIVARVRTYFGAAAPRMLAPEQQARPRYVTH
jgi:hypothetical protein